MKPRITLITLGTKNLARARAFYEKMGFEASSASSDDVVFFKSGGAVLALYPREKLAEDALTSPHGSGFSGIVLAHNVLRREDVAFVLQEAATAGGRVLKSAQDVFWGGHSGYFADPDGHLWEVAWNPHFKMNEDGEVELP